MKLHIIFCFEEESSPKKTTTEKKNFFFKKQLFQKPLLRLPVDRHQLGLEDERGATGDLGRGAHRACFLGVVEKRMISREQERRELFFSSLSL